MNDKVKSAIITAIGFIIGDVLYYLEFARKNSDKEPEETEIKSVVDELKEIVNKLKQLTKN